jgi:hypothetical protein
MIALIVIPAGEHGLSVVASRMSAVGRKQTFAYFYCTASPGADFRRSSFVTRSPLNAFWAAMGQGHTPWSHGATDIALTGIYQALGFERPDEPSWSMWRRWHQEEVERKKSQ